MMLILLIIGATIANIIFIINVLMLKRSGC